MNTTENASQIHGQEELNIVSPDVQQNYPDTCAVKSQQLILNDFGIPCTEDELVQMALENGWYTPGGTAPEDVGKLIEAAGIPCTQQYNANIFNLVNELSQGHKVIVGVDADELWHDETAAEKTQNWMTDFYEGNTPNHALIVAGVDTSDPNDIRVIVTDPGNGDLCKSYPLEQFMDAWSDSSCYMVSTDVPVPQTVPGMENFSPEVGYIENIAGVPFQDFQVFNDMSYGIPVFAPIDTGTWCFPMNSFVVAFFDYADSNIMFNQIFSDDYMFNNYIDASSITPQMQNTFNNGLDQTLWDPMASWSQYAETHQLSFIDNGGYSQFLESSYDDFTAAGDWHNAAFCEQQMRMMDYCDHFDMDFYDTFFV